MNRTIITAVALGLAVFPLSVGSAGAQTATARATTSTASSPVREVYPRDLMTIRERFDMWRAMRNARTMDEKMELWATKHAELEKRAAEQGVKLREMGPMMGSGSMMDRDYHNGERNRESSSGGQRWGSESRMGMMGSGGGAHMMPPRAP